MNKMPSIHLRKTWSLKRKAVAGLILANLIAATSLWSALAASPTFGQKILPMDCVFETINDGTGTLHYLTPATCGVVITPSPTEPDIPILSPQTNINLATNPSASIVNLSPNAAANNTNVQLPWQQIVTQNAAANHPIVSSPSRVNGVVVASTALGIVAVIALVVFLL